MNAILEDLVAGATRLSADPFWRALLAENVYWASCEGFLQSSLLGAFNLSSKDFVADRERVLHKSTKPDLIVMRRHDQNAYLNARFRKSSTRSKSLANLARAVVQCKVTWMDGCATGSAVIEHKIESILEDAEKLRAFSSAYGACQCILGILVSGSHRKGEIETAMEWVVSKVRAALSTASISTEAKVVPLLSEHFEEPWLVADPEQGPISSRLYLFEVCPGSP